MAVNLAILAALGLAGCGAAVGKRASQMEAAAEAAYPPEGRFVEVDGRRVHVVVAGHGPDLVLIHGASGNTRDFTHSFVDRVKDRYRVLVFDRPGLGYTDHIDPRFAASYSSAAEPPALQARTLQAAAAKLGADKPIVLGQSYGGAVALAWALERPEALSALVIVSGATQPWPGRPGLGAVYDIASSKAGGAALVPLLTAFPPEGMIMHSLATIFAPQPVPKGYAEYIGIGLALRRDAARANARQLNRLRPHLAEMSLSYGEIHVPTEIVHGLADGIVPHNIHSERLVGQIPHSTLTQLPGVGHMPHHVAPHKVVDAIDRAARRAGLR